MDYLRYTRHSGVVVRGPRQLAHLVAQLHPELGEAVAPAVARVDAPVGVGLEGEQREPLGGAQQGAQARVRLVRIRVTVRDRVRVRFLP